MEVNQGLELEEGKMSYREKTGWISLIAMAVTFGPYFGAVGSGVLPETPMPNLRMLSFLAVTAVAQLTILGIGNLVLRARSPQEAHTPADERDLAIMRRSVSYAYHVLIVGMILVGGVMPFNSGGWKIINAALFMIVLAEIVHHGVSVLNYRRQA